MLQDVPGDRGVPEAFFLREVSEKYKNETADRGAIGCFEGSINN